MIVMRRKRQRISREYVLSPEIGLKPDTEKKTNRKRVNKLSFVRPINNLIINFWFDSNFLRPTFSFIL